MASIPLDRARSATPVCTVCGSSRTRPYVRGEQDWQRDLRRPFLFYLCESCGLRFQCTTLEEASRLYLNVQQRAPRRKPRTRRETRCDAETISLLRALGAGNCLLDVGCGGGEFIQAAQKAGFECIGTDISPELVGITRRTTGATAYAGQLCDLDLPLGYFDVVNIDQVLMYVPNPREVVCRAAQLLKPGGLLRIREYDASSLRVRLAGKRYPMYWPTFVNVFAQGSIRALGKAAGLKLIRTVPGTEISLKSWLGIDIRPTPLKRLRAYVSYFPKKLRLLGCSFASDTTWYLKKPE